MRNRNHHPLGFTLIELMIAVALVAILLAVALPSYKEHIARGRRADARAQLMQAVQFMERFGSANDSYALDRAGNEPLTQMPANLKQAPADGGAIYELEIPSATLMVLSYELRMKPVSGGVMQTDKCGTFAITSNGARSIILADGSVDTGALRDTCWK